MAAAIRVSLAPLLSARSAPLQLAAAVLATAILLATMLAYAGTGFSFTDDSFYLVWMDSPWSYSASTTQFGFVYRPVYLLLGGDIAGLRRFNVASLFVLAWLAMWLLLRRHCAPGAGPGERPSTAGIAALSFVLASGSLILFRLGLYTPSYNGLVLAGLILALCGLLLAERVRTASSGAGWALLGFAGALVFLAKPTSAAALLPPVLLFLVFCRRWSWAMAALATAVAIGVLLLAAVAIDGSPAAFASRLERGAEAYRMLDAGHDLSSILRLDSVTMPRNHVFLFALLTGLFALSIGLARTRVGSFAGLGVALLCTGATVLLTSGAVHLPDFRPSEGLFIWSAPVGALAGALAGDARAWRTRMGRTDWAIAAFLLVCPYVCAFGTNNNYWYSGAGAGLFAIAAGAIFACRSSVNPASTALPAFAGASLLLSALLVSHGITYPYGQALSLHSQTALSAVRGSRLFVRPDFRDYLNDARRAAARLGFREGTAVIDLTGRTPGLVFALGGRNFPDPWMIGGYRGSAATATAAIARTPCAALAHSWLLLEPEAGRALPLAILAPGGLRVPEDYQGTVIAAPAMDGAGPSRQFLLAPRDAALIERRCEALRRPPGG